MIAERNDMKSWVSKQWRTRRTRCVVFLLFIGYLACRHLIPEFHTVSFAESDLPATPTNSVGMEQGGEDGISIEEFTGGWSFEEVPNPKFHDADNWVCNPDGILGPEAEREINDILQRLEDSLTVEVAVVALDAIERDEPHDFALSLFNTWGVGKDVDDNGLLIMLTRDLRDITFITGYGLEGVLPDIICKRIQMDVMVPHLHDDDWDKGMIEGVKAVAATLYGSDYRAAPPETWSHRFCRTTPTIVLVVFGLLLFLINLLTWKSVVGHMRPKNESTEAALTLLNTCKPLTIRTFISLIWLVPIWPALIAIALWYWVVQRPKTRRRSRTCPKCHKERLKEIPLQKIAYHPELLTDRDRKELELKTAYIGLYSCTSCGEHLTVRVPLETDTYEQCPACRSITLHREEKYCTVKAATTTSEGVREARHKCLYCGAEYIVGYKIPKISSSSGGSGCRSGGSRGGSFGGGSSGGGGSSSRF